VVSSLYSASYTSTSCTNGRQKHLVSNWFWFCFWTLDPRSYRGHCEPLEVHG